MTTTEDRMTPGISDIMDLIRDRAGLVFNDTQKDRLALTIQRMMVQHNCATIAAYHRRIQSAEKAFMDLIEQLTTSETYFYREPRQIELLVDELLPEIMQRKAPFQKINILSAGCATGAEPYSLAIAIAENYGVEWNRTFSITGIDIDACSLEKARQGVFSRFSFRSMEPELQKRYFSKMGNHLYQIRRDILSKVDFHQVNLVSGAGLSAFKPADVIFYRNVSIYFDPHKQRSVFERLSELLEEKGCLIMSSTEVLSHDTGILPLKEIGGVYVFFNNASIHGAPVNGFLNRAGDSRPASIEISLFDRSRQEAPELALTARESSPASMQASERAAETILSSQTDPNAVDGKINHALDLIRTKHYDEALRSIDTILDMAPEMARAYLLKAGILMQMKRIEPCRDMLQNAIRLDRLCLEGYLLLGLIARDTGDSDDAIRKFKEAIYIAPECWNAHFHLAGLYRDRGETEAARREYKNVMKLLEHGRMDGDLIFFIPLFNPEQVRHFCRHAISKLEPAQHRA